MKYIYWDLILNNPKRIEIYLSGCLPPHCEGCHNPESWDFNTGNDFDSKTINKILNLSYYFDNIWVLGGEPLDQIKDDLIKMLDCFSGINKKIWLWTKYNFEEIDKDILDYLDYIKCGKFIDNNSSYITKWGFKLGSSNQRIYKLS